MFLVHPAKTFGYQHFNVLLEQLVSHITKQLLRLSIHQDNLAFAVRHDHGIRCGFEESSEFALGLQPLRGEATVHC